MLFIGGIPTIYAGSTAGSIDRAGSGWIPLRPAGKRTSPLFVFKPLKTPFEHGFDLELNESTDRKNHDSRGDSRRERPSPMALVEKIRFLKPVFELRDKFDQIPEKISDALPGNFFIPLLTKDSADDRKSRNTREPHSGEQASSPSKDRQASDMSHDQYYLGYRFTNPDDDRYGYWFIAVGLRNSNGGGRGRDGRAEKKMTPDTGSENSAVSVATKKEFQGPIVGLVGKF